MIQFRPEALTLGNAASIITANPNGFPAGTYAVTFPGKATVYVQITDGEITRYRYQDDNRSMSDGMLLPVLEKAWGTVINNERGRGGFVNPEPMDTLEHNRPLWFAGEGIKALTGHGTTLNRCLTLWPDSPTRQAQVVEGYIAAARAPNRNGLVMIADWGHAWALVNYQPAAAMASRFTLQNPDRDRADITGQTTFTLSQLYDRFIMVFTEDAS